MSQSYYHLLYAEIRVLAGRDGSAQHSEILERILDEIRSAHRNPFKLFGDYSIYAALSAETTRFRQKRPRFFSTAASRERYDAELALRETVESIAKGLLGHAEPKLSARGGIDPRTGSFVISSDYLDELRR